MMVFLRWLARVAGGVVVAVLALWLFGPREPVALVQRFDPGVLDAGVDQWLADAETAADIVPGTQKRVIWAGAPGARTDLSIVYIHGFSATSEEIRPVPDRVAAALGANLYFARMAGHGRGGAAMAGPTVQDWMDDMAEAMAIGRAIGDRVVVIGTSTGATWAVLATEMPGVMQDVAGIAMISPNFRVANPAAAILTWPAARWWAPVVAGAERRFEPSSDAHGRYWTTAYPTVALVPMAAAVKAAAALDHGRIGIPALFVFDPADQVIDHAETRRVAAGWGGPVTLHEMPVGPGDDPYHHVIAGDILSPGRTDEAVAALTDWIADLLE